MLQAFQLYCEAFFVGFCDFQNFKDLHSVFAVLKVAPLSLNETLTICDPLTALQIYKSLSQRQIFCKESLQKLTIIFKSIDLNAITLMLFAMNLY